MTAPPSIPRLEGFQEFQARLLRLNGLHNPNDPVHAHLAADEATWKLRAQAHPGPADDTPLGQAVRARKALVSLHNQYPNAAPAWEQAAYMLRGLAGLQPFGAASDRTGWDYVAHLLLHHRMPVQADEREVDDMLAWLGTQLQQRFGEGTGFQRANLLDRDLVGSDLAEWFRPRINSLGSRAEARLALA